MAEELVETCSTTKDMEKITEDQIMHKPFYRQTELVDLLGVRAATLIKWGKQGILHPIKVCHRVVLYDSSSINKLINDKRTRIV